MPTWHDGKGAKLSLPIEPAIKGLDPLPDGNGEERVDEELHL